MGCHDHVFHPACSATALEEAKTRSAAEALESAEMAAAARRNFEQLGRRLTAHAAFVAWLREDITRLQGVRRENTCRVPS